MTAVDRLGRAYELYRQTASSRSAILLLIANVIPLVGVLFFGWSLLTILVLYWLENGIVGFWNVPKIILAKGLLMPTLPELPAAAALAATGSPAAAGGGALPPPARARPGILGPQAVTRLSAIPRTGLAIFFAFHYGMFWFVHGIFVFALPAFAGGGLGGGLLGRDQVCLDSAGFPTQCTSPFGEVVFSSVLIGGIALFLSHGASFVLNYIGRGEYLTASPAGQMGAAYGRVVVLHLTIIFGSIIVAVLGAPIGALIVLVTLKTALDLGLHLRERRRARSPISIAVAGAPAAAR